MGIEVVVIRVVTHCVTVDAFVASFAKLSTDTSIFIPTQKGRTVGIETGFSIRLADESPVPRGLCDPMLPLISTDTVKLSEDEAHPTIEMAPLFPPAIDCEIVDEATEPVETEKRTILGMPPLVPPRRDTEKMSPIERAAIVAPVRLTATSAPLAVIDEDAGAIVLPFWKRVRAWVARAWQKLSSPAASRAPQAR